MKDDLAVSEKRLIEPLMREELMKQSPRMSQKEYELHDQIVRLKKLLNQRDLQVDALTDQLRSKTNELAKAESQLRPFA